MDSKFLFNIIIGIIITQYIISTFLDYLNARKYKENIPKELNDVFDEEEYRKSQSYKKDNYRFGILNDLFSFILTISFLIFGGFEWVDNLARNINEHSIVVTLVFFGIIIIGSNILSIPFSYYQTFVIEEKFGFNKTSKKLFFIDLIKGMIMTVILGGGILALVILFLEQTGTSFWLYAWGLFTLLMIFMNLFYSKLIVPLFNKQTPLEEGNLKIRIESYAKKIGFELDNIFVIDGSKRSTKANAYFSGFGKQKRVTLFDTLINDLNEEEIVAVLAHEIGHYKRKHIIFNLLSTISLTGLTLYILSLFINSPELSLAIGVSKSSFHAAIIGFALLYSPISTFTGLIMNFLSRKFEFQADNFAKETFAAQPLISSLKKLSKNNLSNLTPHSAYVFMYYSHPPLIERISNLKA